MIEPIPERDDRRELYREVPAGFGDLLPDAAEGFFRLRRAVLEVLGCWGYRPTVPPLLEYAEVFARALAEPARDVDLYKIVDRGTGLVLALRPDFTPQVARMAASRLRGETLPLRLCYEGPVLRHVPDRRGRSPELHQAGAELLGVVDAEADAEVVAVVIACLKAAGLQDFKVDIGQVEFFRGILQGLDLAPDTAADLTASVARKDVSALERLLEGASLPDAKKRLLAELPLLAGGPEVLDRAAALVESDHSRAALDNIAQVVRFVGVHGLSAHLTVDLGELRGIDYHTGVIFEAFVPHLGTPLCRGGRYDRLLAQYGLDCPATGFSLDLVGLLNAARQVGAPPAAPRAAGVFIVNFRDDRDPALALGRDLRAAGVRAARDLVRRPLEESLAHARRQEFRWAAILGGPDQAAGQVLLRHLETGREETHPLQDVTRRLAAEE